MVGANFRVRINTNKERANQESKKVNSFSKNHSRNYSNRQIKNPKRILTVSCDTPSDTFSGLHEQHLNLPKNVIIGHLKETGICLLSETKIDDSFPNSQFFAEGHRMFRKDRNKTGGSLIHK